MLHFEGGSDDVLCVRIHPEGEGGAVALGAVVVVGREDLDDLPGGAVLRQDGAVVLQEARRVVVDVLHDDGERGCRRLGRVSVVDGQDFDLGCYSVVTRDFTAAIFMHDAQT